MATAVKDAITQARQLAARGDFVAARHELDRVRHEAEADPRQGALAQEISTFTRTLEVLEALDAVRAMLRENRHAEAADASARIAERLSADDYAELGIAGSALTLLSRAGDLARRTLEGRGGPELRAFVDYMADELGDLERRKFNEPLARYAGHVQGAGRPSAASARTASTLGELLSRRPWRSSLQPKVEPEPPRRAPPEYSNAVPVREAVVAKEEQAPVLGKILIEQEAKAAGAPLPQTQPTAEQDAFDIIGKAVTRNWHVVAGMMMLFGLGGYLFAAASPPKYVSRALLQRGQPSNLRAPVTGNTAQYLPTLPRATVLKLATLPGFHDSVANRLKLEGWTFTGQTEPMRFTDITGDQIASSLAVTVDDTGGHTYYIEFAATHTDERTAVAMAGAAAAVFMAKHKEHIVGEAQANERVYTLRLKDLNQDLDAIAKERMNEFKVGEDTAAAGRSTPERVAQLMLMYNEARSNSSGARTEVAAAKASLENYEAILADPKKTPPFITNTRLTREDPELSRLNQNLARVEDEILQIDRKRGSLGPEHPLIKQRLPELFQDKRYIEDRIEVIRSRTSADDPSSMIPNPSYMDAKLKAEDARGKLQQAELKQSFWTEQVGKIEAELVSLKDKLVLAEDRNRREASLVKQKERAEVVLEDLGAVIESAGRELQLIQPAVRATPVEPKLLVSIAAGLVAGLIVGIAVAIMLLRRRKLTEAV